MKTAIAIALFAAQAPLPELRVEPAGGGSVIHIRNVYSQPLTAFLIELVDYPGSSFSYWQDSVTAGIPSSAEKTYSVGNMTIGAVPDYVKVQAALYADGSSSGAPEKIVQLIGRRKVMLQTTRELIGRIEKAQSSGISKTAVLADLRQWAETKQSPARGIITDAAGDLEGRSVEATLLNLRGSERALAASKPVLEGPDSPSNK
jgi:hypothetical protein